MNSILEQLTDLIRSDHIDGSYYSGPEFDKIAGYLGIDRITSRRFMRYTSDDSASVIYDSNVSETPFTDDVRCELDSSDVIVIKISLERDPASFTQEKRSIYDLFTSILSNHLKTEFYRVNYEQSISYDSYTGITNLNFFYDTTGRLMSSRKISEYTAAFLNIKEFGNFNRLFGSRTSNEVLKHFAIKAAGYFDMSRDEVFSRVGGDNFVFICRNENVDEIVDKLSTMDLTIKSDEDDLTCTIRSRIGLCKIDLTITSPEDLMTSIAAALKYSRIPGNPDVVYYNQETQKRLLRIDNFVNELKNALEERKFLVYYQPIIKVENGNTVICAEALLRWRRHDMMMTPSEFIPVAEENGFIYKMDLYVLETVCTKLREWQDEGLQVVPISCNFSRHDLTEIGLPATIVSIIDKYGIDHSLITIEFTEAGFHEEFESIYNTALRLREEGVKVAIDNFGTGYSSLSLMSKLSFDYLKIDSSLGNSEGDKNDVIFDNVVDMAKKLGYMVICEGINSSDMIDRALEAGCDTFQSDFFAKACSERFFVNMIKGQNAGN